MSSKHKDELNFKVPQVSPTLFKTEQGEPLCFYLRPGPVKRELKPLIEASGGLICNFQKPGTILLKDPEERANLTETTAHWYISTKYIHDCVEKNERLNIEDYRLNPESTTKTKLRQKSKVGSPGLSAGRTPYSAEEDEAILRYVSTRVKEIGGNKLWQEMDKQKVTSHTWQSMKYRYKVQLAQRQSEFMQTEVDTEKEKKKQETKQSEAEAENEENSSAERISVDLEESGNKSPDMVLTQVSLSDEQADVPQFERNNSEPCELLETSKSEIDETPEQQLPPLQPEIISEKEDQPDAANEATSVTHLDNESSQNPTNRPVTRQQSELENVPYVKRLRSSGTPPESPLRSSNKLTGKTKSSPSPNSRPREAQTPPRKVRRTIGANVVEQIEEEEGEPAGPSVPTHLDQVMAPVSLQPTKKNTEKRKLGILRMATKEFEDDSESESDDQYETPGPSTSIEAVIATSSNSNTTTSPSENQNIQPEAQHPPPTIPTTAAATTSTTTTTAAPPAAPCASHPAASEPTTAERPPVEDVTSKAHLFIFESESQEMEEESQSLIAGPTTSAAGQTNGYNNGKTFPLTQDQLEEDVQLLKDFMKETQQDLVTVTKAILRASGDLVLAQELLLNLSSFSGPIWTRTEDQQLCSGEATARQGLLLKYGDEGVAKRLMFLELEK